MRGWGEAESIAGEAREKKLNFKEAEPLTFDDTLLGGGCSVAHAELETFILS